MKLRKFVMVFLFAMFIAEMFSMVSEAAGANIASGVIDEEYGQITWVIDSEGHLTVTGTGDVSESDYHYRCPWYSYSEEIKSAEIDVTGMTNATALFADCTNMVSVDLSKFETENITDMSSMFYGCKSLTELDISNFETENVTTMRCMFYGCKSLIELDVSNLKTANATDMYGMFEGCESLSKLDVSNFETSNVIDMGYMFSNCESLAELNLSEFDTGNVTNTECMFFECESLIKLDVSNFKTNNLTNLNSMFRGCSALIDLNLSSFETIHITSLWTMFYECFSLKKLDISNFDIGNVTEAHAMFEGCNSLEEINAPKNCQLSIELPGTSQFYQWTQEDGTIISELPMGNTESILLVKNHMGEWTETPTATLIREDGIVTGVKFRNNDHEYVSMYYGLATKAQIREGGWCSNLTGMSGGSAITVRLEELFAGEQVEKEAYYIIAYAQNNMDDRSPLVVIEEYPITVEETVTEDAVEYQSGDITDSLFFVDNSKEEYIYAEVTLQVTYEYGYSGESICKLPKKNGIFFLDKEFCDENYAEWSVESVVFYKMDVKTSTCKIVKENYSLLVEGETYEEVRTEKPMITLEKNNKGIVNGISVQNNDEEHSYVYYGLATKEQIESGKISCNSGVGLENSGTVKVSLKDVIENDVLKAGEYYFVGYTEAEDKVRSELTILENYPIRITTTSVDDSLEYQMGSITGNKYFKGKSEEEYDSAKITLQITDEFGNTWNADSNLSSARNLFYFNDDWYDYQYQNWAISKATFHKINMTDTKCEVECITYTSIKSAGTLDEKKGVISEEYGQIVWQIDNNGKLTVAGIGDISLSEDYDRMPWNMFIEEIVSAKINVSDMTNASYLFSGCENMTSVDLRGFDTSKVTNMSNMFGGCESLTKLDVSGFDTSQVADMSYMFYDCESLTKLDVSGFDTSQVTDMSHMFNYCENVTELDVSEFDTSQVTDMTRMFGGCHELADFDVSGFDTSNVTSMREMFGWCYNIKQLDLSKFVTSKCQDFTMFLYMCESLTELDVSGFDTTNAVSMEGMFDDCESLTELDVSGFDTSQVTDMNCMFCGCSSLDELDVSNFDTSQVTDMSYMFKRCENLATLDLSTFDMSKVTDVEEMLFKCDSLTKIKTPKNCAKLITLPGDTWYMAENKSIEILPKNLSYSMTLTKNKTPDVVNIIPGDTDNEIIGSGVVNEGYGNIIWEIDQQGKLSVRGTGNVNAEAEEYTTPWAEHRTEFITAEIDIQGMTNASFMFFENTSLKKIDDSKFDTSNITNMHFMFGDCTQLSKLDISHWDTAKVVDMTDMFFGCESLERINMSGLDTRNVTAMAGMFGSCDLLKNVNLEGIDTSNVTDMGSMFWYCEELEYLDLSGFDMRNVTDADDMFYECGSLEQIEAPLNCSVEVELPTTSEDDKWYLPDGTVITHLPQGLTESITIMKNQIPEAETPEETTKSVTEVFYDLSAGSWYLDAVQYVYDHGIMSGSNELFNPTGNITRAQVVATLYKLEGSPKVTDFSALYEMYDVRSGQWYTDAVCWAYSAGVANGNSTTKMFNLSNPVTRQQLATFFYNYAEYKGFDTETRKDISDMVGADQVASYALDTMQWAVGTGLISGSATKVNGATVYDLKPTGTATRAQVAAILQRFCENYHI